MSGPTPKSSPSSTPSRAPPHLDPTTGGPCLTDPASEATPRTARCDRNRHAQRGVESSTQQLSQPLLLHCCPRNQPLHSGSPTVRTTLDCRHDRSPQSGNAAMSGDEVDVNTFEFITELARDFEDVAARALTLETETYVSLPIEKNAVD